MSKSITEYWKTRSNLYELHLEELPIDYLGSPFDRFKVLYFYLLDEPNIQNNLEGVSIQYSVQSIKAIVISFLEKYLDPLQDILWYEPSNLNQDGRQHLRLLKFRRWFQHYPFNDQWLMKEIQTISQAEHVSQYYIFIISEHHPYKDQLVTLLGDKKLLQIWGFDKETLPIE